MDSFNALRWQWEMGATDFVGNEAVEWFRAVAPIPPAAMAQPNQFAASVPVVELVSVPPAPVMDLSSVQTLEDLRAAIEKFDRLEIKKTATQVVFGEGAVPPRVLFIGEAPGADEDAQGRPFVGVSGQLLDKMLAAIKLSRTENAYITNVIHWRPPGNRQPTPQETTLSMPFVRRHIALLKPEFMVVLGGSAAKAVLDVSEGITRIRGQWRDYVCESGRVIPTLIMFHPAYLLRAPNQKALAWKDLQALQSRLENK